MSTQTKTQSDAGIFLTDDDSYDIRLFVIYASSETVGIDGTPLQQIPLLLIEDDADGSGLAREMVKASEEFPAADGWIIEYRDAEDVPPEDVPKLINRLSAIDDVWDEFIGLPNGTCTACGGTGYLTMDCCADGQRYELRGDCDVCDASGQS